MSATRSVFVKMDDEGRQIGFVNDDGTTSPIEGVISLTVSQPSAMRSPTLDMVMLASGAFQFDEDRVNVTYQNDHETSYRNGVADATRYALELLEQSYLSPSDVVEAIRKYAEDAGG